MQPLLMLALYLIVAILVIWMLVVVLNQMKLGEPWRSMILVVIVIILIAFLARQLGLL